MPRFINATSFAAGLAFAVLTSSAQAFELAYLRILPGPDVQLYAERDDAGPVRATVPAGTILRVDAHSLDGSTVFVWRDESLNGWGASERFERVYPRELFFGIPIAGACRGTSPSWEIVWNETDAEFDFGTGMAGTGQLIDLPFHQMRAAFAIILDENTAIVVLIEPTQSGSTGMVNEIGALGLAAVVTGSENLPEDFSGACTADDEAFIP